MKLTKKAAALLLAASLAVSVCATPVFAADMGPQGANNVIGSSTLNTTVYYAVTEGFTWSVPTSIDFGKDAGVNNTPTVKAGFDTESGTKADETHNWVGTAPAVKVTKNTIKPGKSLKISLSGMDGSLNGFTVFVKNDPNGSISSDMAFTVKTTKEKKDGVETAAYQEIEVEPSGSQIFELNAGVNTGAVALEFKLDTAKDFSGIPHTAEIAGKYTGRVEFTADATT